ncbi:hypothetical protein PFJ87_05g02020 [Encephalitozoon hellem]|uniref:Uncharacterized protein n=1 Tax=Encephalitozoon hellem TaxID=27973 RepID=A0ABY8CIE4_ENCHE|nr:hypothetical protein PFJ87_01g02170 [Encephalitozoon hellem]WEL37972.1 hypothetical protein PFJ87_02g00080 [Encephalitozoon hellem]WEL38731.1 hypothetical protein PFJ87_05g02020 [Encephalitozoon hellem]
MFRLLRLKVSDVGGLVSGVMDSLGDGGVDFVIEIQELFLVFGRGLIFLRGA